MRWITLLALCACGAHAFAATVTGSITLAGAPKMKVEVGYVGLSATHQQVEGIAGTVYGAAAPNTAQTEFDKRKSIVHWAPRGGFTYQFTNVPPGKYLVYARAGNRLEEWKMLQVSAGVKSYTTNLVLNPAHTGGLRLKVSKGTGRNMLLLTPCAPNGASLYPNVDLMRFAIVDLIDGNNILLKNLKPGTYLVDLGGGKKNAPRKKVTVVEGKVSEFSV